LGSDQQLLGQIWAMWALTVSLQTDDCVVIAECKSWCELGHSFCAMSVTRRNTFDIFDESQEEPDLYVNSGAKTAQKKKRRKKTTPVEPSIQENDQAAAEIPSQFDRLTHEVVSML